MSIEQLTSNSVELNYARTARLASIKRRRALISVVNRVCTGLVNPIAGKMSRLHNRIPIRFDYVLFEAAKPRGKTSNQNHMIRNIIWRNNDVDI